MRAIRGQKNKQKKVGNSLFYKGLACRIEFLWSTRQQRSARLAGCINVVVYWT